MDIKTEISKGIATVKMQRGKANAINISFLKELQVSFKDLVSDDTVKGIILEGNEGIFSAGLDVIEIYSYTKEQVMDLFVALKNTMQEILIASVPTVAAISGHAPAGGCVLASCCDYRIMVNGNYKLGLNEVGVGIVIPFFVYKTFAHAMGNERNASRLILASKLMTTEEALAHQFVDQLVESNELKETSINYIKSFSSLDKEVWSKSKKVMLQDLMKAYSAKAIEKDLESLDAQWWQPASREILKKLVESLQAR